MAHDHEEITYGMNEVKELFDASVLTGTIVSVDTDNDKAHVNISGFGQINDVPIFYHCPGSIVVEGGSTAFEEGDSVYVLNKEGKVNPGASDLQIVGFVDGLKDCCIFKEHWGETLCENNDGWGFFGTDECEIPEDYIWSQGYRKENLEEGILKVATNGLITSTLTKKKPFVMEGLDFYAQEIKIKIAANVLVRGHIHLRLVSYKTEGGVYYFDHYYFAALPWSGGHDGVFIGDNDGAEQTIIISDYFDVPESANLIEINMICGTTDVDNFADYELDFLEIKGKCTLLP